MKYLFSLIVFTIIFLSSSGQLVYDFEKGQFTEGVNNQNKKIISIPSGAFATLKIININTFRYKVELEGKNINYVTPIPSELQTIFRLSSENFDNNNLSQALRLTNSGKQSVEENNGVAKNLTVRPPLPGVNNAQQEKEKKDKENAIKVLDEAMQKLTAASQQYAVIAQKVANIKFTRMELINLSKQRWKNYNELQGSLPERLSPDQMKKDYQFFVNFFASANSLFQEAENAANDAEDKVTESDKKKVQNLRDAIKSAETNIKKGYDLFQQDDFIKLIDDVTLLQDALDNPEYFEVKSAPIQIDGDYVNFNLKISPAPVNSLMPYEISREFPVEIPVKGGLKVDFSVGPAISFGKKSRDEIYFLAATPVQDSFKLTKRDNNNSISPSIAAMMHFGPRSGKEYRFGGMFGVGAGFQSESKVDVDLYLGLSAVIGKRERIMISAGASFLRVSRLKTDEYNIGKLYGSGINADNVSEKVFKGSFFISLSYNLTNRLDLK